MKDTRNQDIRIMLNENKLVGQTPPYKAVTRYELLIQLSLGGINLNPDFPSKYVKRQKEDVELSDKEGDCP